MVGNIKAVVLDWAGTVVDYGCFGPVEGMRALFTQRDIPMEAADVRRDMGLAKGEHIRKLIAIPRIHDTWKEKYGVPPRETDIELLVKELEDNLANVMAVYSTPIPGALDVVAELRKRGIRIGSSTGYTASIMEVVSSAAREFGYEPDAIVTVNDVPAGRPHPFMCYENAIRLGVYPLWQMVKVGDTVADVLEGRNAGMWTVGVVKGGNELGLSREEVEALPPSELQTRVRKVADQLKAAGADYVIEEIGNLLPVMDEIEQRLVDGGRPA
ncbi:MAG: phosphonoacetaldehyde hydrolase [Alicyclobacillus sp.]|nr:phosphonoacetaldehyde hydrolase [Alicyclobacillus sp.]